MPHADCYMRAAHAMLRDNNEGEYNRLYGI